VAAVTLLVLLAGCSRPGLGGADPGVEPASAGPDEPATMPTEIPSWLLECGADKPGRGEPADDLQLADLDLTQARWSTPSGFAVTDGYVEDNPVETVYSTWYAEPTDPPMETLNVLQVVIYTGIDWGDLADDCGRVPLEAVEEKLAQYREQIGAEPLSDAEMTEVAGRPAIHQDIRLARYSYTGYWLFSRTQLLHVYCQWTDDANRGVIERGCDDSVASISVG
jgi:hypothetical protein